MVEIKMIKDVDLKGYTLIEGFPGIGLIGTIAVGYLTESKKAELVGYITSRRFPPMASIHKGKPLFPARIYLDKKNKVILLFSEFVVPSNTVYEISDAILQWAKSNGIKRIISLAGMTSRDDSEETKEEKIEIYGISSTDAISKLLEKHHVNIIAEGVTTGVSGVLLAQCNVEKFPAMSLLVEATQSYPDPGAAAVLLEKVKEITGMDIKTKELEKEAKEVESKMKRLLQQMQLGKEKYQNAEQQSPMYR